SGSRSHTQALGHRCSLVHLASRAVITRPHQRTSRSQAPRCTASRAEVGEVRRRSVTLVRARMTQQANTQQVNLHLLLKAMLDQGATDLHITQGSPPMLRLDGRLIPLRTPPLRPDDSKALC